MTRVAILCPGRGSYTEATRGSFPRGHELAKRADDLREREGLAPLSELDAQPYRPSVHLAAANASPMIWLISLVEAERVLAQEDVAAVAGNSMGWYTALAASGALAFEDGFRLVQAMALLQEEHGGGGQLIYPEVGDDWRPDAARAEAVRAALEACRGEGFRSIHLGGYAVLAGTNAAVQRMMEMLPPVQAGRSRYPLRLAGHGPYHTPLLASVSARARRELGDLGWRRPRVTLVDGRGVRHTPWSADPAALRDYTLGAQVTTTFDLTRAVRVILREHAPAELVLPGPGNTLGGVCGQILAREGWRGVHSKADFDALQATDGAVVRSLGC